MEKPRPREVRPPGLGTQIQVQIWVCLSPIWRHLLISTESLAVCICVCMCVVGVWGGSWGGERGCGLGIPGRVGLGGSQAGGGGRKWAIGPAGSNTALDKHPWTHWICLEGGPSRDMIDRCYLQKPEDESPPDSGASATTLSATAEVSG